jgi:predicted HicB family RNase H-like nuclease
MKEDTLIYKDFIGTVHYSNVDECFFGKLEGTDDLVTFEGQTVEELQAAFREAVDDYLSLCEESGKKPYKSFKGSFNVRVSPELHKKAFRLATSEGLSLNQLVQSALEHEVKERLQKTS